MSKKRFTIIQDGNNFTVRDTLKGVHMGMFEFKENEFPVFACFCRIIDLLNELNDENQQFKEALKELKEIGDYQAMRIKELDDENRLIENEIDKKITLLIDAKIQCWQNEDEELFGKIKFGIQILNELKEVIE